MNQRQPSDHQVDRSGLWKRTLLAAGLALAVGSTAFVTGRVTARTEEIKADPIDQLLVDFARSMMKGDTEAATKLFLEPDDTPAGKNRKAFIADMNRDWKSPEMAKHAGKIRCGFRGTTKIVRTKMLVKLGEGEVEASDLVLSVVLTEDGWKFATIAEEVVEPTTPAKPAGAAAGKDGAADR
jgi:hypothetical protein